MAHGRKPTKLHPSQELATRADVLALIERVTIEVLDKRYVKRLDDVSRETPPDA